MRPKLQRGKQQSEVYTIGEATMLLKRGELDIEIPSVYLSSGIIPANNLPRNLYLP